MKNSIMIVPTLSLCLLLAFPSVANPQLIDFKQKLTKPGAAFFAVTVDNDALVGRSSTDEAYTNGLQLIFGSHEPPTIFNNLFDTLTGNMYSSHSTFLEIAQNMYTPRIITDPNPNPDDRPYAGWTRIGYYLVGRNKNRDSYETIGISIGTLGDAGAGFTQSLVHQLIQATMDKNAPLPKGWRNHIKDRIALYFVYSTTMLFCDTERSDLTSPLPRLSLFGIATSELGNVFIRQSFGLDFKAGIFSVYPKADQADGRSSSIGDRLELNLFVSPSATFSAYNGTLDPLDAAQTNVFQVPVILNLEFGIQAQLPVFGLGPYAYLRWVPLYYQTADFALRNALDDIVFPPRVLHGIGRISIEFGW